MTEIVVGVRPEVGPLVVGVPNTTSYLFFTNNVDPASGQALLKACQACVARGDTTVHLLVSSAGGDVNTGFLLFHMLQAFPFELITHNVGNVDSIANVIFLAGHKRYAGATATFMFHGVGMDVRAGMRLELKNTRETLNALQALTTRMAAAIVAQTNFKDLQKVTQLFEEASTKDAAFALEHGFINEIRELQLPAGTQVIQVPATT
jgi:ATP-dependent Clp protease protease subunit